jgi:hypothetical protein
MPFINPNSDTISQQLSDTIIKIVDDINGLIKGSEYTIVPQETNYISILSNDWNKEILILPIQVSKISYTYFIVASLYTNTIPFTLEYPLYYDAISCIGWYMSTDTVGEASYSKRCEIKVIYKFMKPLVDIVEDYNLTYTLHPPGNAVMNINILVDGRQYYFSIKHNMWVWAVREHGYHLKAGYYLCSDDYTDEDKTNTFTKSMKECFSAKLVRYEHAI